MTQIPGGPEGPVSPEAPPVPEAAVGPEGALDLFFRSIVIALAVLALLGIGFAAGEVMDRITGSPDGSQPGATLGGG